MCCVFWPAFGCCTYLKAGWNNFFSRFQPFLLIVNLFQWFQVWNQRFFFDFRQKFIEKRLKWRKKVEYGWRKVFWPAFGCAQHPKAGRNTQHECSAIQIMIWIVSKHYSELFKVPQLASSHWLGPNLSQSSFEIHWWDEFWSDSYFADNP